MPWSSLLQRFSQRLRAILSSSIVVSALFMVIVLLFARRVVINMEYKPNPNFTKTAPFDFNVYYLAALSLREGFGPYTALLRPEVMRETAASINALPWVVAYYYPPLTAQLILPLTLLPLRVAGYVWLGLLSAATIAAAWFLGKSSRQPYGVALALLLLLGSDPTRDTLFLGQINGLVLLVLCAALYAARRSRWGVVGIGVAVAAMLKIVPGVYVIWLALTHRWRAFAVSLLAGLVLTLAALPSVGIEGLLDFIKVFQLKGGTTILASQPSLISLSVAMPLLLGDGHPASTAIWRVGVIILVGLTALACGLRPKLGDYELEFAVLVLVANLVAPYTWYHQACLYMIPFFVLITRADIPGRRRWLWPLLGAYGGLTVAGYLNLFKEPLTLSISLVLWGVLVGSLLHRKLARPDPSMTG